MTRCKILWVVYDFVQAGGQRYVYEITRALDKARYDIDFLRVSDFKADIDWEDEFYQQLTTELGCNIYAINDFKESATLKKPASKKKYVKSLLQLLGQKKKLPEIMENSLSLVDFFSSFRWVNFSGVSVYKQVCIQREIHPDNAIIHILSAKFQHPGLYNGYDKQLFYRFISGMKKASIETELEDFSNYEYTHFNLCFKAEPFNILQVQRDKSVIAVFTRLSPMKPLDPYFYALKLLVDQEFDVELDIYGAGDPEALGLLRQLDYLYLRNKVSFKGHVEDISSILKTSDIDLVWFQASNSQPAGYVALDVAMSGLPQIFWDFMYRGDKDEIRNVFPSHTNLLAFVSETKDLLSSVEMRIKMGKLQREYILENYAIENKIAILEEIFAK